MKNEPIAIVGMGTLFPGSQTPEEFWNNSLNAKCFIREVPEEFWSIKDFYDPDPSAPDKTYSKMAGIVDPVEFNPMEFGIPPKVMQSICVEQLYGLILARQALIDAGLYGKNARKFDNNRAGVIISASVGKNSYQLNARVNAGLISEFFKNMNVPEEIIEAAIKNYKEGIIEWDESSNPGYLANVVAGRIANRFNLKGTTCNVDAACASSLGAVKFACQELMMGDCDIMLAGGISLDLSNTTFVSFCKTPALSKSDRISPFSSDADGMLLGDGAGAVVLKRLSTAERDGDRIYALIEGIGSSSDGKEKSIFSPSKEGQMLAVTRSMNKAEVKAEQIGMIEAHGTGTLVGDMCEVSSMSELFKDVPKGERSVVMGGCKGQTGHMRLAAGIASLIRASLAVYHKQFLPSVGCREVNDGLKDSIFYVCQKPMPWIVNKKRPERYATINAFGFGGTNFNVTIKEYSADHSAPYRKTKMPVGIILEASGKNELIQLISDFRDEITQNAEALYFDKYTYRKISADSFRIGFAAADVSDAVSKTEFAEKMLKINNSESWEFKNVFYSARKPLDSKCAVAMFPGQGAQYCGMFSGLTCAYPEMRNSMTLADNVLFDKGEKPVSDVIYSKTCLPEEQECFNSVIVKTQTAQSALAAVEAGAYNVLKARGFDAEHILGHSFGELPALYASGAYDEKTLHSLAYSRGRCMEKCLSECSGTGMMALMCDKEQAEKLIDNVADAYIANINGPSQIIISGEDSALGIVAKKAEALNIKAKRLKVAGAFHSTYLKNAGKNFSEVLDKITTGRLRKQVMSNYTGDVYSGDAEIKENLTMQIFNPVRFVENVRNTYENGGRVFVEIGPGAVLKGLVEKCLSDKKDILVLNIDSAENEVLQMESVLTALAVWGFDIKADKYAVKPDPELLVKKGKNTYSVSPIQFIMPDVLEKMKAAKNRKIDMSYLFEKKEETNNINIKAEENNDEKRMVIDMNKYDAMYEIQKLNASVVSDYLKAQDNQFEQLKELLKNDRLSDEGLRNGLFEYINCFQDNCVNVLKSYLGSNDMVSAKEDYEEEAVYASDDTEDEIGIEEKKAPAVEKPAAVKAAEKPVEEKAESKKQEKKEGASLEKITDLVLKTISDITGYPMEMLECDMTLESDLGIDSIKRLELFSSINEELGNIFGKDDMAVLAAVTSIEDSAEVIKEIMDDPDHEVWSEADLEAAKAMTLE